MDKKPTYGSSLHYSGEAGARYLEWQDSKGIINGKINFQKFNKLELSDKVVLDFGAGTGNLLLNLNCKKKIAIEINETAHPSIIEKGISPFANIEDIESSSVDVVISHHSLEHVPYPILALKEIFRTLKLGGELHLWVPIDDWREQQKYNPNDINHHLNTWTPQLLGNSLKEAGFESRDFNLRIVTHAWFPGYQHFYRFPGFNSMCKIWSILRRRRQINVIAKK